MESLDLLSNPLARFLLGLLRSSRNGSGPRLKDRNLTGKESTSGGLGAQSRAARAVAVASALIAIRILLRILSDSPHSHKRVGPESLIISIHRLCKMGAVEQQQDFEDKEIDASVDFCYWLAFLPCHFGACPFKTVLLLEQEEVTKTDV